MEPIRWNLLPTPCNMDISIELLERVGSLSVKITTHSGPDLWVPVPSWRKGRCHVPVGPKAVGITAVWAFPLCTPAWLSFACRMHFWPPLPAQCSLQPCTSQLLLLLQLLVLLRPPRCDQWRQRLEQLTSGSISSCLQGFLIERAGRKTLLWKNYTVMALALGLLTVTLSLQVRPHWCTRTVPMFYCMTDSMTISLPTNHFLVGRSIFGAYHHIHGGLFPAMYIWIALHSQDHCQGYLMTFLKVEEIDLC